LIPDKLLQILPVIFLKSRSGRGRALSAIDGLLAAPALHHNLTEVGVKPLPSGMGI
jgi:hypothetical protein